jgi:hypothetical protein
MKDGNDNTDFVFGSSSEGGGGDGTDILNFRAFGRCFWIRFYGFLV